MKITNLNDTKKKLLKVISTDGGKTAVLKAAPLSDSNQIQLISDDFNMIILVDGTVEGIDNGSTVTVDLKNETVVPGVVATEPTKTTPRSQSTSASSGSSVSRLKALF